MVKLAHKPIGKKITAQLVEKGMIDDVTFKLRFVSKTDDTILFIECTEQEAKGFKIGVIIEIMI
jgi:hypothetical protein